jgi:hypothetical protein
MNANHCGNTECKACTDTEQKINEIHEMLTEVMPAARIAVKMMNARHKLMSRWVKD